MLKPFDEALRELVDQYESAHHNPFELRAIMSEIGRELTHDRSSDDSALRKHIGAARAPWN